jgi:hypothetical protein
MYALALSVFGVMLFAWSLATHAPAESQVRLGFRADQIAANFWTYREAVVDYLAANSGHDGAIADSALTAYYTMDGFTKSSYPNRSGSTPATGTWAAVVSNGTLYTYSTAPPPQGVAPAIAQRGGQSMAIAVTQAGSSAPTMSSVSGGEQGLRAVALPAGMMDNVSGNVIVLGR